MTHWPELRTGNKPLKPNKKGGPNPVLLYGNDHDTKLIDVRAEEIRDLILNFPYQDLNGEKVVFQNINVHGDLLVSAQNVKIPLGFKQVNFHSNVRWLRTTLEGHLSFNNCSFCGTFKLDRLETEEEVAIRECIFHWHKSKFEISNTISDKLDICGNTINRSVRLSSVQVNKSVNLARTKIVPQNVIISIVNVKCEDLFLEESSLTAGLSIEKSEFSSGVSLNPLTLSTGCNEKRIVRIGDSKVAGEIDLQGISCKDVFSLYEGKSDLLIDLSGSELPGKVTITSTGVKSDVKAVGATLGSVALHKNCPTSVGIAPSLNMNLSHVTGSVIFSEKTRFSRVSLSGMIVGGDMNLKNARIEGPPQKGSEAQGLNLAKTSIGRTLTLPEKFVTCVDLSFCASVGFEDFETGWREQGQHQSGPDKSPSFWQKTFGASSQTSGFPDPACIHKAELRGFTFEYLANPLGLKNATVPTEFSIRSRMAWLEKAAPLEAGYQAGHEKIWKHFSIKLNEAGQERAASQLAIARRIASRSHDLPRHDQFANWLLQKTSEYGYKPFRTILWCAIFILAFASFYFSFSYWAESAGNAVLWFNAGGDLKSTKSGVHLVSYSWPEGTGQTDAVTTSNVEVSFNPLLYSLDVFVPIIDLGYERHWVFKQSGLLGFFLDFMFLLERVIGSVLIAISIFGFTGLLERES